MKTFYILLLSLGVVVNARKSQLDSAITEWNEFKSAHNKRYTLDEDSARFQIWRKNAKFIQDHNEKADAGLVTFRTKMNRFGDLTADEFFKFRNGLNTSLKWSPSSKLVTFTTSELNKQVEDVLNAQQIPSRVDWTNLLNPVRDQGPCGSCWSFSSNEAIEAQYMKKFGKRVVLSEQQLMDCSRDFGNEGCNGGYMVNAFVYIINNQGIMSESDYPYNGHGVSSNNSKKHKKKGIRSKKTNSCKFNSSANLVKVRGLYTTIPGDESHLEKVVAHLGPTSVSMCANLQSFQFYSSGIYNDSNCKKDSNSLDHAVLAVGFDNDQGYWHVMNSWGTGWGDNGFFKLAKGSNACGIALDNVIPIL